MSGRVEMEVLKYIAEKAEQNEFYGVSAKEVVSVFGRRAYMTLIRLQKKGYIERILHGFYRPTKKGIEFLNHVNGEVVG